jgi:hypothetical protein
MSSRGLASPPLAASSKNHQPHIDMNGYLTFLKSLTQYQQRAEIARLVFDPSPYADHPEDEFLKSQAESEVGLIAGEDPADWMVDLHHGAEYREVVEAPVFADGKCTARFVFRYLSGDGRGIEIPGLILIDAQRRIQIAHHPCRPCSSDSLSRDRLIKLGIDPDTCETVSFRPWQPPTSYLDWLRALLPEPRHDAISDLMQRAWGLENDPPLNDPGLASLVSELIKRGVTLSDLYCDSSYVGSVECKRERCTAHLVYNCYAHQRGDDAAGAGSEIELHILADIIEQPNLSIKSIWYRIDRIEAIADLEEPMLLA